MVGRKLYQRKSKVYFFLVMYAILALVGAALIAWSVSRNQNPSAVEGFTLIFGGGMAYLTWSRSRKPRVVIGEEYLELRQQRKPEFVKYKSISNATRTKDHRLVLGVREGHGLINHSVLLKDLEDGDAEKLTGFCEKKGWKRR
ncbi:MAG: hypothetical protein A2010_14955 [Nitrospirae bacterium GWD2_57_9]|nr:MAG: hypothetical protein A2010_14955 [Nitrospirae bacterium GWD2_57_9]OGW50225.1 MAG: hypothetical protein A2078_03930 [Nitrospirae bacterium GWC2_57_9]